MNRSLRWSLCAAWLGIVCPLPAPGLASEPSASTCEAAGECCAAGLEAGMAQGFEEARQLFRRALDLEPHLYEASALLRLTDAVVAGGTDPQGASHVYRGAVYFGTSRFEEALREFSAAVARDSQSALAHYYRGLAFAAGRHDWGKALASLSRAIELDPGHESAYASRGQMLSRQRDFARALLDFEKALSINPTHVPALVGRADAFFANGEPERALASYNAALAVDDRSMEAHLGRAGVLSAKGEPSRALSDLDAVLRVDARHEAALLERARIYGELANMDIALEAATAAIAVSDSARAYQTRAILYQKAGDHRSAVADLETALQRDDKDGALRRALGESLEALGDDVRALEAYDAAIRLDRRDAKAFFLRAALRIKKRLLREASGDLSQAIELDTRYAEALSARSAVGYVLGDYAQSAQDAKKAAVLLPLDARSRVLLGRALLKLNKAVEATQALKEATSLQPAEPFADYCLGVAHETLGQYAEAAELFRRALVVNPGDSASYLHLGDVLAKRNALPQALDAYRRCLELRPYQYEPYRGLAEVSRRMGRTAEAEEFEDAADRLERERVLRSMNAPKTNAPTVVR